MTFPILSLATHPTNRHRNISWHRAAASPLCWWGGDSGRGHDNRGVHLSGERMKKEEGGASWERCIGLQIVLFVANSLAPVGVVEQSNTTLASPRIK